MKHLLHSTCLARVTYSLSTAEELTTRDFNALNVSEKNAILIHKSVRTQIQLPQSLECSEGDTVLISESGTVRMLYSVAHSSHTLFLTAKCNSNCIMCPYTSAYRQHATNYTDELLLEMVQYLPDHTEHLVVTGGEPTLLGPLFFTLMRHVKERFPQIVCLLLTNGRSLSLPDIADQAVEYLPHYTTVAIPLHAASEEMHDHITQTRGSFRQTMHGIHNLLQTHFYVELRIVVFKENLDEMTKIAELICRFPKRVQVVHFMAAEMCGNAAINRDSVWVDYSEAFKACEQAINLLIYNGIDVELYNFPLCSVPEAYWALYRKSISDYKIRYGTQCDLCVNHPLCGGVFVSSLKLAERTMQPVTGEIHEDQLF